ncbi:F-box domain containing protein [Ophiocordyceps camponoti-floridani]|uniref:F-box domain containing protein n=1 Tax=Ophiocordyceps camponoti-floridani TaxID=2030778 RepID=A0A8H4VBH6_9HYPO|nr:F-box domain containing protein [Ophiocordyceps camponoti-floridani]
MHCQWRFHVEDCRRDHQKAHWEAFKVPPTLKVMPWQNAQPSALEALPTELLLSIMTRLGPTEQLFLALTSKKLLAISSLIKFAIPSARKHRAGGLNCTAMLVVLRTLPPRGPNGRASKAWAPCCDCYRYRPKKLKGYWKQVGKRYTADDQSDPVFRGYGAVVESWGHIRSSSYQCPECWCLESARSWGL